ncbi:unnamed protein product [Parascedosporium putredinis]|uniref:Uncharacterized protein n=1 Tax=Parascedosporium putredinis TaxID=1442378 RepID=A0A9P1HCI3_9PEZI|nr:unnamed protein product [Parascedosporium putredinis]CAI8004398.1 unnamed protein product [Parascedosporium putredinis]
MPQLSFSQRSRVDSSSVADEILLYVEDGRWILALVRGTATSSSSYPLLSSAESLAPPATMAAAAASWSRRARGWTTGAAGAIQSAMLSLEGSRDDVDEDERVGHRVGS